MNILMAEIGEISVEDGEAPFDDATGKRETKLSLVAIIYER